MKRKKKTANFLFQFSVFVAITFVLSERRNILLQETPDAFVFDNQAKHVWSPEKILTFMTENPQRAYFSRLFRDGGFKSGIEVGVADGRFSEHFLVDNNTTKRFQWTMIEPFPNKQLLNRYSYKGKSGAWKERNLLRNVDHHFFEKLSLDEALLQSLPDESYDFIYLDGDHSYDGVKAEIPLYWKKVKTGGVLAGHDYCNWGEKNKNCLGCENIPECLPYTEYGVSHGKRAGVKAENQNGVVQAIQEWVFEKKNENIKLHHTIENFTRESLTRDGMDFDLIITNTRNPSWFILKTS